MIRIKNPSDKAPENPQNNDPSSEGDDGSGSNGQAGDLGKDLLQSRPTSEEKPNVSPFGFSSAGDGMAKGFLGDDPAGSSKPESDHQTNPHRSSESAAEARRARRQRADLPPLPDDPMVKALKILGTGIVLGGLIGGIGYNAYPYTEEEKEKGFKDDPELNELQQTWQRVVRRWENTFTFFSEPATEKLLPDPNEYTMPYTLVLNLDDMLVHMDWSKENGWRIAKRPGLNHFIEYMASMFEVVVFSTQPSHSGMLVMERLDPLEYAPYRLYKDHMRNIDGKNYKDLTTINRDMSRVILIDISPDSLKMQPDNVLMARPFHGNANDNWIEQITEFLEYVHMMEPKDVRPWIKTYKGMDAAREFNKWEDSVRKKLVDEWEEKRKNAGSWKSWVIGGLPSDLENPPVPDFDRMRKMMRENFEIQHKEVLALIEKDRKHNEEEMQRQMKDMTVWKVVSQAIYGQPQTPTPEGYSDNKAPTASVAGDSSKPSK
ncbi:mitochondrial inner membrane protein required for protein import [Coemansia sp. RSA 1933]|nr:mitochondrial inner membrane protein required for protein import [Coemansia sp. RSA 1933]